MPRAGKRPLAEPDITETSNAFPDPPNVDRNERLRLDAASISDDNANNTSAIAKFIATSHKDEEYRIDIKELGFVARLLVACLDLFDIIIKDHTSIGSLHHRNRNILKRSYDSLRLWTDGHGVVEGKLDHALEKSKRLWDTTLLTLNSLCGALLLCLRNLKPCSPSDAPTAFLNAQILHDQTKYILGNSDDDTSDSDSECEQSLSDEDREREADFVEDIKTYTTCLVDLSTALECPAIDPGFGDEPVLPRLEERSAHEYYVDLISSKFPKADADLADCLGKASWDRYKRLQTTRERNEHNEALLITTGAQSTASKPFKDSGLGTTIYAQSIISYVSSLSNGQRVQIPPLSAEAKKGERFECSACGDFIIATTNREWRKHIFGDLLPYTCFYPECNFSSTPFPDRSLWIDHLNIEHQFGPGWKSKQCPLCFEPTGDGKSANIIHLSRHMEEIALASLPRGVDSEANSEAESSSISNTDFIPDVDQVPKYSPHSEGVDWKTTAREISSMQSAGPFYHDFGAGEILPMQSSEPFYPNFGEGLSESVPWSQTYEAWPDPFETIGATNDVFPNIFGEEKAATTNLPGLDSSTDKTIQPREWYRHVAKCTIEKLTWNEVTQLTNKAFEAGIDPSDPVVIQLNQRLDFLNGVFGASRSVPHTCGDCGKEFKRPSDLTKHLKTHSRPWKCTVEKCKYFDLGWPTEKERDRHINDKHSDSPAQYKCSYPPCTYASKRESNTKQHMEKAHGWEYLRHKSNRWKENTPSVVYPLTSLEEQRYKRPLGSPKSIVSPSVRQMSHASFSIMADSDVQIIDSSLNLAPSSSPKSADESDPVAPQIEATSFDNNDIGPRTTKKNDSDYQMFLNEPAVPPQPTSLTSLLLSKSTGKEDHGSDSLTQSYSRTKPSVYWSIAERDSFYGNVAHFGTDWAAIASHMGTKTQTMVKNHYLRLVENRRAPELERRATEADSRRKRGEKSKPPSAQIPVDNLEYCPTDNQDSQAQAQNPEPGGLSHVPMMPPPEHPIQSTDQETTRPPSSPKIFTAREQFDEGMQEPPLRIEPDKPAKAITFGPAPRSQQPSNSPETPAYGRHDLDHKSTQGFVCFHCGKTCARAGDLTRHMKLHDPQNAVTCGGVLSNGQRWGCGTSFARADILRSHHQSKRGRRCVAERDGEVQASASA